MKISFERLDNQGPISVAFFFLFFFVPRPSRFSARRIRCIPEKNDRTVHQNVDECSHGVTDRTQTTFPDISASVRSVPKTRRFSARRWTAFARGQNLPETVELRERCIFFEDIFFFFFESILESPHPILSVQEGCPRQPKISNQSRFRHLAKKKKKHCCDVTQDDVSCKNLTRMHHRGSHCFDIRSQLPVTRSLAAR